MEESIYTNGTYLNTHPTWHAEDSAWKAAKVIQILQKNSLNPESIIEIGCGAGEILSSLQRTLPESCSFIGFEIAPDAYRLCHQRANARLRFTDTAVELESCGEADLVMALDVVEHVEDYFSFLRLLRPQGRYCLLHVPLDLSLQSIVCGLPQRVRKSAGHLHYFTAETITAAVKECGFTIVDTMYTRPGIERRSVSLTGRLARYPRWLMASVSDRIAAITLGGFSIMILARSSVPCG